jgi:hypothetical protein
MKGVVTSWLRAMGSTWQGRVAMSNLLHDLREKRLRPALIGDFLRQVAVQFEAASKPATPRAVSGRAFPSPTAAVTQVLGVKPTYLCQGLPAIRSPQACSRVLRVADLVRYNVDTDTLGWLDQYEDLPDDEIKVLETSFSTLARGSSGNADSKTWVTKTSDLDVLVSSTSRDDVASTIRNRLGLKDVAGEDQIIELIYPPTAFDRGAHLLPPTFFDGAPAIVFRSHVGRDGWGKTIDLTNSAEGLPEAVHRPIPIDGRFSVRYLGRINRLTMDVNFYRLWLEARHPWKASCRSELLDLV